MLKNIIIGALVAVAILFVYQPVKPILGGSAYTSSVFDKASTSVRTAVTTGARILGSSTPPYQRAYTIICNDSAQVVYLNMNGDKPFVSSTGVRVAAGACYEISQDNLYTGAIWASSTNQTSSFLNIVDYTL